MTERPFEQLLERCLQEVTHAGDAKAVLQRYPQHADRLRPLLDVALATSRYYTDVPEPQGGLAAGRVRLLDAAAQQRERVQATQIRTRKEKKPKMKLLLATRLISAILAAVIGTAAVGGGVTWAASDSLPGDVLYPVKLAGEDLRLSFASRPESQVELALQFADERVAEVEALAERGSLVPETAVTRMERHVFRAMNQAAWASEEEMPGLLKRIAQRMQVQAQTLEQLRARAQAQNQAQHENQTDSPQDEQPGDPDQDREDDPQQDQDRDRQQDREGNQQQDQDRDRDQDREDDPQQDQDRDRQQDREGGSQQDEGRSQQQEQQPDQERDQQQDQQPDQERDQQQDPQRDGQSGGTNGSGGPGS